MEPVVLVTGSAQRIGACIARAFHDAGYFVLLHCRSKVAQAEHLMEELNQQRLNSAALVQGDIAETEGRAQIYRAVKEQTGSLDVLIHNASAFYPTPIEDATEDHWDQIMDSNVKGPYFLTQSLLPLLQESRGKIVFLGDVYGDRPLEKHSIYSASKSSALMMTQALAQELGPDIRVNAVSPGAILWPEHQDSPDHQATVLDKTALKRTGTPLDIARTVLFVTQSEYVTGQNIRVDGGRSINI